MSGTTTTTTAPAVVETEPLLNAQFIVAVYMLTIVAAVLAFVLMKDDMSAIQAGIASSAVTTPIGAVVGFYFGSAKSGATKDATIATLAGAPPPVVPAATVVQTGTTGTTGTTGATGATGPIGP